MTRRNIRLSIFALALMGVALIAMLGVYESIPAKANPPDKTAEAIRELQKSQQQAADRLRVFQQAASSDRTELKRLSDDVTALTAKIEALQESFSQVLSRLLQFSQQSPRGRSARYRDNPRAHHRA